MDDRIKIGLPNRCSICDKYFQYTQILTELDQKGLYEVNIRTQHIRCRDIVNTISKLKQQITDLEFELYQKKHSNLINFSKN